MKGFLYLEGFLIFFPVDNEKQKTPYMFFFIFLFYFALFYFMFRMLNLMWLLPIKG
jgi:hypothetical protein